MGRPEAALFLAMLLSITGTARADIPAEVKQALASRDYAMAVTWLEAHRAEPEAAFELGKLYRLGKGVPKDQDEAQTLFEVAGRAGNTDAQYLLARRYEREGDIEQARYWMNLAAAAGYPAARDQTVAGPAAVSGDPFAAIRANRPPPQTAPGFELEMADGTGRTPLLLAAGVGSATWVEYLLRSGANPDARDQLGATPLHVALANHHVEAATLLLDAGADASLRTRDGNTALHLAVTGGATSLASRLLTAGADADVENDAGWTPRQLAKRSDDASLHRLFGIETQARDALTGAQGHDDALRLAQQAARRADATTLKALLKTSGRDAVRVNELDGVFFEAAAGGRVDVLGLLIRSGIDVEAADGQQRTALMLAAQTDCVECVDLLVKSGARAYVADPLGRTPLILAARDGRGVVVEHLAAAGAPLDTQDDLGRNALWWACRSDHGAVALRLLELGAPATSDAEGTAPLHLAAANDAAELIAALVAVTGPEVAARDGGRPLMIAARAGAGSAVTVLLDAGAEVKARNDVGDTALIIAVRAGQLAVTEQLLKAGANPKTRNDRFESAASLMAARSEPEWDALLKSSEKGLFGLFGSL